MNNTELNALLDKARQAQKEWDDWPYDLTRQPLSSRLEVGWSVLHAAITSDLPVSLRLATGGVLHVGSVGTLTENLLLFYSEIRYAGCCMEAVDLRLVTSIEKVEAEE